MTYWQASSLMEICRSGEFRPNGKKWASVFGQPGRFLPIDNRRMEAFIRRGWVELRPMVTTGEMVARVTRLGSLEMHRYFERHHRSCRKSWERIIRAQEATG